MVKSQLHESGGKSKLYKSPSVRIKTGCGVEAALVPLVDDSLGMSWASISLLVLQVLLVMLWTKTNFQAAWALGDGSAPEPEQRIPIISHWKEAVVQYRVSLSRNPPPQYLTSISTFWESSPVDLSGGITSRLSWRCCQMTHDIGFHW